MDFLYIVIRSLKLILLLLVTGWYGLTDLLVSTLWHCHVLHYACFIEE